MINQLHYATTNLRTPESIGRSIPPHSAGPLPASFPKSCDFDEDPSFNISAQADTTLLTPDSAAHSPESQHTKFTSTYPTPPSCSTSLLQDNPGARMFGQWNSSFDLNTSSSQTNSPMTTQASVGPGFISSFDHDHGGRRTPGPPENSYMGNYGVSDSQGLPTSTPNYAYAGLSILDQHNHPGLSDPRAPERNQLGVLHVGHSSHYKADRRNSLTESAYPSRSMNGSPGSGVGTQGGRVRKPRRTRKSGIASGKGISPDGDLVGEHMNCRGQEVPPTLKQSCPDEERCIFESRWRHRKDKGQDMWDGIQRDYERRFCRPPPVKETLQMKFKRARSKYIEWLPEDIDKLEMAWKEMEEERYETLLQKFLKRGGSRNMLLNATDIEFKVVQDLKLEEGLYMPYFREKMNMDIRRRQKANPPKKRSNARHAAQPQQSVMVKMEPEDTSMVAHAEDEIIEQIHEARQDYDKFSDSGNSGSSQQHNTGRWGPGVGMMGTPIWGRQSVEMPPMADQLLSHGGGQGIQRRQG